MDDSAFFSRFTFDAARAGAHGVEREFFLYEDGALPVPRSPAFLRMMDDPTWTYELSACQVEHRTAPHLDREALRQDLADAQARATHLCRHRLGMRLVPLEVAPEDMPLDVYPDDARYAQIVRSLPPETLAAACRVAGVHIHRGAKDLDDALRIHNLVAKHLERFMAIGDHSNGERLRLYAVMAKNWRPPHYLSQEHFYKVAVEQGFASNPRDCWHLVRISRHGTVELRMFGMTGSVDEILSWVDLLEQVITEG